MGGLPEAAAVPEGGELVPDRGCCTEDKDGFCCANKFPEPDRERDPANSPPVPPFVDVGLTVVLLVV